MGGLRFELYAAREVDTQVETLDGDRNDGRQHQQPVHCECVVAPADEIDIRVVRQKSQKRHGAGSAPGGGAGVESTRRNKRSLQSVKRITPAQAPAAL